MRTASGCMHCWLLLMSCKCPRAVLPLASGIIRSSTPSLGSGDWLQSLCWYTSCFSNWCLSFVSLGRELDCCVQDEWVEPSLFNQQNAAIADQLCCNRLLQFIQLIGRLAWSDLVLVRKMLGSSSLWGCLCSLPWAPALQLHFCFLYLLRLGLPTGMVNHREPNVLAMAASILYCHTRYWRQYCRDTGSSNTLRSSDIVPAVDINETAIISTKKKICYVYACAILPVML